MSGCIVCHLELGLSGCNKGRVPYIVTTMPWLNCILQLSFAKFAITHVASESESSRSIPMIQSNTHL